MIITVHRVVVKLSGDQISTAKASKLVSVVNNNAASLSVEVKNVVAGNRMIFYGQVSETLS